MTTMDKAEFDKRCLSDIKGYEYTLYEALRAQLDAMPEEARESKYRTRYECAFAGMNGVVVVVITGFNTWNQVNNFVEYRRSVINEYALASIYYLREYMKQRHFQVKFKVYPLQTFKMRWRTRYFLFTSEVIWRLMKLFGTDFSAL